MTGEADK